MSLLLQALGDEALLQAVREAELESAENEDGKTIGDIWQEHAKRLEHSSFVLPVMGVQGSGKSTLLTALCFDKPVLPIDADETTAVPVEIVYSSNPSPNAQVHFAQGAPRLCLAEEQALAQYVHQAHNPGNRKQVQKIVLECNQPFLRNGLILVDLPGLGSLTDENRQTTLNYLKNATAIMYLLRAVPTITRSESIALGMNWRIVPSLLMVQNRWNDESNDDTQEALAYNQSQVYEIAEKANRSKSLAPQIMVVDAYQAWKARLSGDMQLAASSHLDSLLAVLEEYGEKWQSIVKRDTRQYLLDTLKKAGKHIAQREELLRQDVSQARQHVEDEYDRQKAEHKRLKTDIYECEELLDKYKRSVDRAVSQWSRDEAPSLRNSMRKLMRGGVTDGGQLSQALTDYTTKSYERLAETAQEISDEYLQQLTDKFALSDIDLGWAGAGQVAGETGDKVREFLPAIGAGGGAVGGGIGGAVLATTFLGSNPVGWALAGAIAITSVVAIIGGWLFGNVGSKGKQALLNAQIDKLAPEIDKAIEQFLSHQVKQFNEYTRSTIGDAKRHMEQWQADKKEQINQQYEGKIAELNKTPQEKELIINQLQAHGQTIKLWLGKGI